MTGPFLSPVRGQDIRLQTAPGKVFRPDAASQMITSWREAREGGESMSRKSVQRFCDNDMRQNRDLKHVAQKCAAVLRQRHA
jgi:hypothetical protein